MFAGVVWCHGGRLRGCRILQLRLRDKSADDEGRGLCTRAGEIAFEIDASRL